MSGAPFDDTTGIDLALPTLNVSVRNGIIKTPGPQGIGIAAAQHKTPGTGAKSPEDQRPMTRATPDRITLKYEFSDPWNYLPPTNYVLESLRIESGGRGVILGGTGNVLRNNTIEVDSATAAYIYGPGAVIEGNTFIVHQAEGEPKATSAILKLRDAHGAVIRNNRFIVKGLFTGQAEAAVNLLESTNVTLEGNVFEGAKTLVRKDATSTTIERGNEKK